MTFRSLRAVADLAIRVVLCLAACLAAPAAMAQDGEIPEGMAQLVVITNFDNTEVTINGTTYPYEWIYNEQAGVLVPADRFYEIIVATSPEQRRTFRMTLDEGEMRILVVDVENIGQAAPARPTPVSRTDLRNADEEGDEDEEEEAQIGYLGVSSSPRGIVYVDGESTGQRTPARRIELEPGRHEVQVMYDEAEELSEVKHVLIRSGVNTNVFFRQQRDAEE